MRLGKEEARGFIEEPVEVLATPRELDETEPRRVEEPGAPLQDAPRQALEDQPASSR